MANNELVVNNQKRSELISELEQRGYDALGAAAPGGGHTGFDYLLRMPVSSDRTVVHQARPSLSRLAMRAQLWSLTSEKLDELCEQRERTQAHHDALEASSPEELWRADLDELSAALPADA